MAFIVADRVRDTATTTGTGVFTVSGLAPSTYRTLSAVCSVNDTLPYFIQNQSANEFEVGIGTYSASNQLTRTAANVLSGSSGVGTLVSFSAGTKDVVLGIPARNAYYARQTIYADTNYFVNGSTGSDSNDGLASGTAFLTIQHAYDVVSDLDFNNFIVTINVADGTYAPGSGVSVLDFTTGWVGGGTLAFVGNTTTPANCVLSSTNTNTIVVNANLTGIVTLAGFKLTSTTSGNCIQMSKPAFFALNGKMEFGACAGFHIVAGSNAIFATQGNPYTISGGATYHIVAISFGQFLGNSSTVTLTGTPAFTIFAYATRIGFIDAEAVTYSGAATGTRYVADNNSVIYTGGGGANYFPGNVAGSTATGGQYS